MGPFTYCTSDRNFNLTAPSLYTGGSTENCFHTSINHPIHRFWLLNHFISLRAYLTGSIGFRSTKNRLRFIFFKSNTFRSSSSTVDMLHQNHGSTLRSTNLLEHLKESSTKFKFSGVGLHRKTVHSEFPFLSRNEQRLAGTPCT